MAKKDSKSIKRKFSDSTGMKHRTDANRLIRELTSKVRRWDSYRAAGKTVSEKNKNRSRFNNWDTSGMLTLISIMKTQLKQPSKCIEAKTPSMFAKVR